MDARKIEREKYLRALTRALADMPEAQLKETLEALAPKKESSENDSGPEK